jgi:hypothetical protein
MSGRATDDLVAALAADVRPVRVLAPPLRRALATLAALALAGGLAVWLVGDTTGMLARYAGRETLMALEMAAMTTTALLAVAGAFFLSIPGGSRRWLLAPLPAFALWFGLSGLGCYQDLVRQGPSGLALGHSMDCLGFILAAGLAVGAPLLWRLSRARPIEPMPVALLAGLGAAALAALLLQFFHPFALTLVDLAVHFGAVLIVVAIASALRRQALAPA